jgi:hypothetical protein
MLADEVSGSTAWRGGPNVLSWTQNSQIMAADGCCVLCAGLNTGTVQSRVHAASMALVMLRRSDAKRSRKKIRQPDDEDSARRP